MEKFKKNLEDFAATHKNDIKKDAEFRGHFQQMCARIGVDPLACEWTLGISTDIGSCSDKHR